MSLKGELTVQISVGFSPPVLNEIKVPSINLNSDAWEILNKGLRVFDKESGVATFYPAHRIWEVYTTPIEVAK